MVVPIRCSPVVGASPAAEEEPVCEASMAGTARSAAAKTLGGKVRRSGAVVVSIQGSCVYRIRISLCFLGFGLPRKKETDVLGSVL
jgi:hypothetical protein